MMENWIPPKKIYLKRDVTDTPNPEAQAWSDVQIEEDDVEYTLSPTPTTEPPSEPGTMLELMTQWIKDNGFDGLYVPGECACFNGDIMPCGESMDRCIPGYKQPRKLSAEFGCLVDWCGPIKPPDED